MVILFPSLLKLTLAQTSINFQVHQSLAAAFQLGGAGWAELDRLELRESLPSTQEPLLLALRRLAHPALGDLRSMHRFAVEMASERPQGLAFVALEEIALQIETGSFRDDQALLPVFASFYLLLDGTPAAHAASCNLQARAMIEMIRFRLGRRRKPPKRLLQLAQSLVSRGTGDPELLAYLNETRARVLAREGQWEKALELWKRQVEILLESPIPDRAAESLADLTSFFCRHHRTDLLPDRRLYLAAAKKLTALPPQLNRKLHQRFATSNFFPEADDA